MGQGKKPPIIGSVNLREEDSLGIHRPQGDITAALISGWLSDFCKVCKGFPTIWRNAKDNLSIDTLEPLVDWAKGRFDYFLRICKECAEDGFPNATFVTLPMYISAMSRSVNMADKNQKDSWRSELTAMSVTTEECCRVRVMYDMELHMVVVRALKRRQSRCQVSVVHPRQGNTFVTKVERK